jgi:hypothetical protein
MILKQKLVRTTAGFMGKAITFIFALFCVITGLLGDVSAQTVTGTVRSRADFSPIRNIQVIMREVMCPLYGMGLPCVAGRGVDTTTTGTNGAFTIGSNTIYGSALELTDTDSTLNGSFQPRNIMQSSSFLNGRVLYMIPKNTTYQVKGKVQILGDGQTISGIRAVLCRSTPVNSQYPPYTYPDLITPMDTVFSDANGSVVFALDTEITKAIISVSDIDSVDNGGKFLAAVSGSFSPINDTATTIITMNKDQTPVSHPISGREPSTAPFIRSGNGFVSVALRNWKSSMQSQVLILDARGVTVARLQPSAGGIVKWNTDRVPRGLYCMCLEGSGILLVARIMLP